MAWELYPRRYVLWARHNLEADEWAEVEQLLQRWTALDGGQRLQMSSDDAAIDGVNVAVQEESSTGSGFPGGRGSNDDYVEPANQLTLEDDENEGEATILPEEEEDTLQVCPAKCDEVRFYIIARASAASRHVVHNKDHKCLPMQLFLQADGTSTPQTLSKAVRPAQRLQWLIARVVRSRLADGLSRESIQKNMLHFWHTEGQERCRRALAVVRAEEGQRVSTDHTYHIVSNLAAQGEDGKHVALKASLTSVMGQSYVLGCKVK